MVLNFLKSGYNKVKQALAKTSAALSSRLHALFGGRLDEATLDRLEQLLYEADLGVETATELTKKIREVHAKEPSLNGDAFIQILKDEIFSILNQSGSGINENDLPGEPTVILIVGVNGNGKTTSVAKLAKRFSGIGKKVLVGAADTFRAAAIEQLETWAHRLDIDIVKGQPKADPAAVAFDTVTAAKARAIDIVLLDTAGRLHTKTPLMQELQKIRRSCSKVIANSPHETLLVLDATTGQNAIEQAKIFNQFTPVTGLILTKLDGSARGGIVVAIQRKLGIPVKFIGVGEGADDLMPFDARSYIDALFDK